MAYHRTDTLETTIGVVKVRELSRRQIFKMDRVRGMEPGEKKEDALELLDEELVRDCVLEWPGEPPTDVLSDVPQTAFAAIITKLLEFSGVANEEKHSEAVANLPKTPSD